MVSESFKVYPSECLRSTVIAVQKQQEKQW